MIPLERISLNGSWQIHQLDGKISLKGQVPGLVHHDLIKRKLVDDPFYLDNELKQQWVGESAWEYFRTFHLTQEQLSKQRVTLICEGLDTLAQIYINGDKIAFTDNMFERFRFDVKVSARKGDNEIKIVFFPAFAEMKKRSDKWFLDIRCSSERPWFPRERMFLRKAQCHSGWDWGPCFLTQGIYKNIFIECTDGAAVQYVTHTQRHNKNNVTVKATAFIDAAHDGTGVVEFSLGNVKVSKKELFVNGENKVTAELTLQNPSLWWPNGYGSQDLHSLSVTVFAEGESDTVTQKIGLRDLQLITEKDKAGECFYFKVNDVPVFCKGSNWIPSNSFDTSLTDEQVEWELSSAAKAHHNMIRVWGGGLYERDFFYQACDKLGIMVWQDFMFACALYPTDAAFLSSVEAETRHQVRRLQHHASIALWCGNNENEQCLQWNSAADPKSITTHTAQYERLYMGTVYPVVREEDPSRRFWPSSPSNGIDQYGEPDEHHRGDSHYWSVWHRDKEFSEYLKVKPRFNSEFGFQSFSSPETMDTVIRPEDRNICSPVFEFHQRNGTGNQRILNHISRQFRVPTSYADMLYVSQALQALSIKTAVEHWRRIKPHNMGTLYWQLNDIWPVASWSSLEFDGRWKMLHYASRKFFAPLLASIVQNNDRIEFWATSDINMALSGKLTIRLMNLDGKMIQTFTKPVRLSKLCSENIFSLSINDLVKNNEEKTSSFLHFTLHLGNQISENQFFFVPFKQLALRKPSIQWSLRQRKDGTFILSVESDTLAPFTWFRTGKTMGIFSDNGMHLLPNKQVSLWFEPRTPITEGYLKKNFVVHDLYRAGA